jgi:hypothetical protein
MVSPDDWDPLANPALKLPVPELDADGVIIEEGHPGFGQYYEDW